jgi:hypothetical protein
LQLCKQGPDGRFTMWRAVFRSGSEPLLPHLACWDIPKPL